MTSGVYERMPVAARFWGKVECRGDCWEWTGSRIWSGYGMFWKDGRYQRAHRVAYELTNGEVPADLFVLHRCDNRGCVNPDHLDIGTHRDNMRDRNERGRTAQGRRGSKGQRRFLEVLP